MLHFRKAQASCFLLMLAYAKANIGLVPVELDRTLENGAKNVIPSGISKRVDESHRGTDQSIAVAATGYLPAFDGRAAEPFRTTAFGQQPTPHPELAPFLLLGRILQSSQQNPFSPMKHFEDKLRMETAAIVGPRSLITSQPIHVGVRPLVDRQRHLEAQRALRQQGLRPHFSTNALQQGLNVPNSPPASYSIHGSPPESLRLGNLNGRVEVPVRESLRETHHIDNHQKDPITDSVGNSQYPIGNQNGRYESLVHNSPHHISNQNGRYDSLVRDSPHNIGNQNGRYESLVRDSPHNIGNQNGRYESLIRDSPHHIDNQNGRYGSLVRDSPHNIGNQNGRYESLVRDSPHYIGNQNGRFETSVHDSPHHIDNQHGQFDASVRGSSKDLSLLGNRNGSKPPVYGPLPDRLGLTNQNGKHDDLVTTRKTRPLSESDSWNRNTDSLNILGGRSLSVHERPTHSSRYALEKDPRPLEHSHRNSDSRYRQFQNEAPRTSHLPNPAIERHRLDNTDYDRSVAARDEENTSKQVSPGHHFDADNQNEPFSSVWKDEGQEQRDPELQPQNVEKKRRTRKRKRRPEKEV